MAKKKSMFQQAKEYGGGLPYKLGSGSMTGLTLLEFGKTFNGYERWWKS